jgi:hypothetical protein
MEYGLVRGVHTDEGPVKTVVLWSFIGKHGKESSGQRLESNMS